MDRPPVDFRIFEVPDNVRVSLVGELNEAKVINPWLKLKRTSISEGIFESLLATRSGSLMHEGNTYSLEIDGQSFISILYIEMRGEYALFGSSVKITEKDSE